MEIANALAHVSATVTAIAMKANHAVK